MAINTWKMWERLGLKKPTQVDIDADLGVVAEYLGDIHHDVDILLKMLKQLKKLRHDEHVLVDSRAKKESVRKQIELYDQFLLRYEYFTEDAQINAIRVKKVAKECVKKAQENKFYALLKKMKRESRWFFDW